MRDKIFFNSLAHACISHKTDRDLHSCIIGEGKSD